MARGTKKKGDALIGEVLDKGGRPSKFNEDVEKQILHCAELGMTEEQIADIVEVSAVTLTRWKQKYDTFRMALKTAKWKADCKVVNSLYKNAQGHTVKTKRVTVDPDGKETETIEEKYIPPNSTAQIFWLKNRQPKEWRDKVEIEQKSMLTLVVDTGDELEEFAI